MQLKTGFLTITSFFTVLFLSSRAFGETKPQVRIVPEDDSRNSGAVLSVEAYPPRDFVNKAAKAKKISDLLVFDQVILLEETDVSLISALRCLVILPDELLVVDRQADQIFRFSMNGAFLGNFAGQGRGPGEFGKAALVTRTEANEVAVVDGFTAEVHFYSLDGQWLRSTEPLLNNGPIGQKLFVDESFWFQTRPQPDGNGAFARLDCHWEKNHFKQTGSTLFARYLDDTSRGIVSHRAFEKVGPYFWVGSPLVSLIRVYDREGRLCKIIDEPVPRRLTPQMWREQTFKNDREREFFRQTHTRTIQILAGNGVIWVEQAPSTTLVFDQSGTMLTPGPLKQDVPPFLDLEKNHIYCSGSIKT